MADSAKTAAAKWPPTTNGYGECRHAPGPESVLLACRHSHLVLMNPEFPRRILFSAALLLSTSVRLTAADSATLGVVTAFDDGNQLEAVNATLAATATAASLNFNRDSPSQGSTPPSARTTL